MLASQPQCPQRPCQQYSMKFQPRSPVNMLHLPQLPTDPECSNKAPNSPGDTKRESNAPQRPCNSACDSTLGLQTPQTKRLGALEGSSDLYAEFFRTAYTKRGLSRGLSYRAKRRIDHSTPTQPLSGRRVSRSERQTFTKRSSTSRSRTSPGRLPTKMTQPLVAIDSLMLLAC